MSSETGSCADRLHPTSEGLFVNVPVGVAAVAQGSKEEGASCSAETEVSHPSEGTRAVAEVATSALENQQDSYAALEERVSELEALVGDLTSAKLRAQEESYTWREKCALLEDELTEALEEAALDQKAQQQLSEAHHTEIAEATQGRIAAEEFAMGLQAQLKQVREDMSEVEREATQRIEAARAKMEEAVRHYQQRGPTPVSEML